MPDDQELAHSAPGFSIRPVDSQIISQSVLLHSQDTITQRTICNDDSEHNPDPLANLFVRVRITVRIQHRGAANPTLGLQVAGVTP